MHARQALGQATRTLTSIVSPGYAPFEQYYSKSDKQGPWTDIYGLAATLYRGIAGQAPLDAIRRSDGILREKNDTLISALEAGEDRYSEGFWGLARDRVRLVCCASLILQFLR